MNPAPQQQRQEKRRARAHERAERHVAEHVQRREPVGQEGQVVQHGSTFLLQFFQNRFDAHAARRLQQQRIARAQPFPQPGRRLRGTRRRAQILRGPARRAQVRAASACAAASGTPPASTAPPPRPPSGPSATNRAQRLVLRRAPMRPSSSIGPSARNFRPFAGQSANASSAARMLIGLALYPSLTAVQPRTSSTAQRMPTGRVLAQRGSRARPTPRRISAPRPPRAARSPP